VLVQGQRSSCVAAVRLQKAGEVVVLLLRLKCHLRCWEEQVHRTVHMHRTRIIPELP